MSPTAERRCSSSPIICGKPVNIDQRLEPHTIHTTLGHHRSFRQRHNTGDRETLNGVTPQQLDGLNPAIMGYITHLHVAIAGFIAATAIAAGGLAWYGVRDGLWWAWITGVIVPIVGLAVGLPMHYMGHFNYDWMSHLGPIYVGTIIYVVGAVVALLGLSQAAPRAAQAAR